MLLELDVVVDVHARTLPHRVDKPADWQRWKSWLVQLLEESAPALPAIALHRSSVEVLEKLEGVKPQAKMWYENEAEFQSRLRDGEVPAGMLYNDVTLVMKDKGAPVETNFVQEGSILDSGLWVTLKSTELTEQARQFIDYASKPEVQDRIAQNLYTSPTIKREHSNIDSETYEKIAGPGPSEAITPQVRTVRGGGRLGQREVERVHHQLTHE